MVSTPDRLDDAADQPALQIDWDLHETRAVEDERPIPVEIQQRDGSLGHLPLPGCALALDNRAVWRYRARRPQARPLESRVQIRRVVDPGNAKRLQGCRKPGARDAEQRPQQTKFGPFQERRHAGQPVAATAARGAHDHRFGLVIGLVRHQQVKKAALAAGVAQETVACLARGLLHAGRGLRSRPGEHVGLDALASQQFACFTRFASRFDPKAMVDDEGDGPAGPLPGPSVGQQREAERVSPARDGDGQFGSRLEGRERRNQELELLKTERCCSGLVDHPQPFFWRSWSIRRFCRSVARG